MFISTPILRLFINVLMREGVSKKVCDILSHALAMALVTNRMLLGKQPSCGRNNASPLIIDPAEGRGDKESLARTYDENEILCSKSRRSRSWCT